MEITSGPLSMELDTGLVRRRDADAESLEDVGPIFDADACPRGLEDHWAFLLDRFYDATRAGKGHEAAVAFSYYERLSVPRMN